jgi:hypothetical protein
MAVAASLVSHPGADPTQKQHLAANTMLFDRLVTGQIVPINPASSVRGPKLMTWHRAVDRLCDGGRTPNPRHKRHDRRGTEKFLEIGVLATRIAFDILGSRRILPIYA